MAGFISPATLEQIRAANDIVEVIGSYLPLKHTGTNFVALCPFHKEKTPSFNVNPQRQIFHCFGCHKGGDVFTFVKEYEHLGFVDAVRRLAERAHIPLHWEADAGGSEMRHLKDRLLQIHEQIAQRWQQALTHEAAGQIARDYLATRGVSAEAVALFRLGFAPDVWDDTVNWAKSKGHELAVVEQAGLIQRKEGSSTYYDRFRGRLMFPICDEQGRVIGFSGRLLTADEKTAKYINSPETPIFTKSRVFYGLDKSKRALLEAGYAIVCEGQLDLIACFMAGVQNVVAPQGTALTADHARILKRYVDEVVLCFDSDAAGQTAAVRSLDSLLGSGLAIRVAVVPAPHDPDSFIRAHGGEAFGALIGRAEGFFDYYLNRLSRLHDLTTDKGRMALVREMAEAVRKTGNAVLVDTYAQKTALRLGVNPAAVRAEFERVRSPASRVSATALPSAPTAAFPKVSALERGLLRLALLHEGFAPWLTANLDLQWIQHPLAREILALWLKAQAEGRGQGVAGLLTDCADDESRALVTAVVADERPLPQPARQLQDIVLRLRSQFVDRQLAALRQRAGDPTLPEEERMDLLGHQAPALRALKHQPLPPIPTAD